MAYEKMSCLWETHADLEARLHGTICRYKNEPVLVIVESVKMLKLLDLSGNNILHRIHPADPEFDVSSPELGYFNVFDQIKVVNRVYYLERLPYRKFRQGLSSDVVAGKTIDGEHLGGTQSILQDKTFGEGLSGTYPSLREGLKILSETKSKEVAVGREVALLKTDSGVVQVYFRTKNIGWIAPESTSVSILKDQNSWIYSRVLRSYLNARP